MPFSYLLRRLLHVIPTLLGVLTIVFFSIRLVPGDPASLLAGIDASPEVLAQISADYGLDKPIITQYLIWLQHLFTGDWGRSIFFDVPVRTEVFARFANTAILAVSGIILGIVVGIGLGTLAGIYSRSWFDRMVLFFVLLGISLPVFWVGLLLIIQFSVRMRIFPPQGMHSPLGSGYADLAHHLVLPAITLSLPMIAYITRLTRSTLLEVIRKQYMLAARAKGLRAWSIYIVHALPNTAGPLVTVIGVQLGYLIGGAVLVEVVFSWPGLGRLILEAVFNRDYPLIQGAVLVSATAIIVINLLTDLVHGLIDPRISQSN